MAIWTNDQLTNSNIVFHRRRLVFMLICKAAATSIKWAVLRAAGVRDASHLEWRSKEYVVKVCPDYYKIAFTRHPIDRIASCWRQKVMYRSMSAHRTFRQYGIYLKMPFAEFIERIADIPDSRADKHFRSQAWDLTENGVVLPKFIGKLENITQDWERLREAIGPQLPLGELGWRNRCPGATPWDEHTLRLARERYADDLRIFYNE